MERKQAPATTVRIGEEEFRFAEKEGGSMLRPSRALRGFLGVIASVSASSLAFASPSIFTNANEMGAIAVVSSAVCKVPLPNYGVAGKYALALYITTVRKNALELVEAELHCGAAETNLVFADFHKDPSVWKSVRVKAIVENFKNIKFNDVMRNFLGMGLYLYHTNHFFL
ncbi:unnamed protein product [Sphagnum jensenii]